MRFIAHMTLRRSNFLPDAGSIEEMLRPLCRIKRFKLKVHGERANALVMWVNWKLSNDHEINNTPRRFQPESSFPTTLQTDRIQCIQLMPSLKAPPQASDTSVSLRFTVNKDFSDYTVTWDE